MTKMTLVLGIILTTSASLGSILEPKVGAKSIEDIKLIESATTSNIFPTPQKLKLIGAGLRLKKVAFIKVKVYLAQWLISDSATWKKSIDDIKSIAPVAIRATFVRDVDSEKIESAFREAFTVNKISLDDPPIKAFLNLVVNSGEIKKGQTFTLLGKVEADNTETLVFEEANGAIKQVNGPSGFLKKIYSIWFGEVAEDSLKDLKESLLGS